MRSGKYEEAFRLILESTPHDYVDVDPVIAAVRARLARVLRTPVGQDGFYNEIHPKLRPVETVVDGVLIRGACQGPKNSAESVASAPAAAAQSAAILKSDHRRPAGGDRLT
ncbi:MAG: hypothetical protein Q8P31_13950 [Bacillota bacterium]|nr:hypothetical protein [Bacillota bacterium]